ncbi:MAG: RDD family protein [Treponema sp.]|nr:RDD family protein [Treponema sp.]
MNMKRIYAWIIDFVIVCIIQTILMGLFLIMPLLKNIDDINISNVMTRQLIITYCSMIYLIVRDIIGKRSIGKRVFKLKIINKSNGNEASILKRFVRNITWILGPIDIIVFLISKERFGDKIAGTDIIGQ